MGQVQMRVTVELYVGGELIGRGTGGRLKTATKRALENMRLFVAEHPMLRPILLKIVEAETRSRD